MGKAAGWALAILGLATGWANGQQPTLGLETIADEPRAALGTPMIGQSPAPAKVVPVQGDASPVLGVLPKHVPVVPPGYSPVRPPPQVGGPQFTGRHSTLPRPVSEPVETPIRQCCEENINTTAANQTGLLDNFSLFIGLDGSKEPIDLGINSNFGYRLAFNWGIPLVEDAGIGLQVGTALNYSHNAMQIMRFLGGPSDRTQSFTTLGIFQRAPCGLSYGFVFDFRFDEYYTNIDTSQWRYQVGYQVGPNSELGFWGAQRERTDQTVVAGQLVHLQPISQWNIYWRHIWANDIATRLWVGIAEEHGRFNILLPPGQRHVRHPFCFGGDLHVPLTHSLAIYGEASFITPNDSGTVTATLGVAWYPGSARNAARSRFAPLFPLANNPNFAVDLQ